MASKAAEVSDVKARKKSAFSCEPCRRRKVKCGGEQPVCKRCSIRKDDCVYKLGPTLSYTQKLEREIEELKAQLDHRESLRLPAILPTRPPDLQGSDSLLRTPGGSERRLDYDGLRLDQRGGITFHGPTSFFQLPRNERSSRPPTTDPNLPQLPSDALQRNPREQLVSNAWQQRMLETMAETPEPFGYLLQSHWCWIQPLFNFVYRPAFTRDMEALGPYYSHMLLNTMLSHSVRWCKSDPSIRNLLEPYEGGALFGRQARMMLANDLIQEGQSTIPTIQTLLLLSAQESSRGNQTLAWLYSGMAFRLVEDMGINIDSQKFSGSVPLSDMDIEIRRRLFWSCYFYDKVISLYFGRSPSIRHTSVSPPQVMMDDSAESELWIPHGVTFPPGREYPPTTAHSISCFMHMCRLSVILNEILIHIYDPTHDSTDVEMEVCVEREGHALRVWWDELPVFLRIDPKQLPTFCPPSHIVTLNCLYHTFKILLYRPMLNRKTCGAVRRPDPAHLVECLTAATSTIVIFDLFIRTFGDSHIILSLSYSVYTAASIFLLQIQANIRDEQAHKRLEFCMRSLDRVQKTNPIITSALNNLVQELIKLEVPIASRFLPPPPERLPPNQQPSQSFNRSLPAPVAYMGTSSPHSVATPTGSIPALDGISFEDFKVTPEMFEAFSSLEPISATVGGNEDNQ